MAKISRNERRRRAKARRLLNEVPIPRELFDEFKGYVEAAINDEMSTEMWMSVIEDQARSFMEMYVIRGDAHEAAMQYVKAVSQKVEEQNG